MNVDRFNASLTRTAVTNGDEGVARPTATFIDLFAGCGGLALGFVQEGFMPVGAVEIDPDAAATYQLNVDSEIHTDDISHIEIWPPATVIIGGPPCQGFSQLGTRDPNDPRNQLWREYVRALRLSGADVFVMENVPQLLKSHQFRLFLDEVKPEFNVVQGALNAADYGVPETRRRAIVIGSRRNLPEFPAPTHGRGLQPHVDVRTALAGLPVKPNGQNWHNGRAGIRPSSITRYKAVPASGGNRFEMQRTLEAAGLGDLVPPCWRHKISGTTDVFGRMWWDRPAPTIRTEFYKPEKGRYLHPDQHRPITVREAARLQSFPDDFVFPAGQPMASVARQIGNAVPPLLARAVARAVSSHLKKNAAERVAVLRPAAEVELDLQLTLV